MNSVDLSIGHRLDAVEAAAYRDMYAAAPPVLAGKLGLETHEFDGATLLIAPGLPTPMFNRVIGLGNTRAATDAGLDEIAGVYQRAGVNNWWIHLTPGARPATLAEQLAARGFSQPPRKAWAKVLRGTEPPPTVDTTAEVRLAQPAYAAVIADTVCAAFEMPAALAPWFAELTCRPGWRAAVALVGDKVIGAGMLHLQGENAWLGVGGVRPEARRHHAHRALMVLRIREAIRSGCTHIITETGEQVGDEPNPSLRNMEACGFTKVCSRLNFAAPTWAVSQSN